MVGVLKRNMYHVLIEKCKLKINKIINNKNKNMTKKLLCAVCVPIFAVALFFLGAFFVSGIEGNVNFQVVDLGGNFDEGEGVEGAVVVIYEDEEHQVQVGDPLTTNASGQATEELTDGTYYYYASKDTDSSSYTCDKSEFEIEVLWDDGTVSFLVSDEATPIESASVWFSREEGAIGPGGPQELPISEGYTSSAGTFIVEDLEEDQNYYYYIVPPYSGAKNYGTKEAFFKVVDDNIEIFTKGEFEVDGEETVGISLANIFFPSTIIPLKWDGEDVESEFSLFYPGHPGLYYHYYGEGRPNIQFKVVGLGGDSEDFTVDFSNLGGDTKTIASSDGTLTVSWNWEEETDLAEDPPVANPFYEIVIEDSQGRRRGDFYVINFNPRVDVPGLDGDTTDWSALPDSFDFTAAEDLVFENSNHGKMTIPGPVNLIERETAQSLSALAGIIGDRTMSLDTTQLVAFADEHGAATLEMYNLAFDDTPSILYTPDEGLSKIVVDGGTITDEALVDSFSWEDDTVTLEINKWSTYEALEIEDGMEVGDDLLIIPHEETHLMWPRALDCFATNNNAKVQWKTENSDGQPIWNAGTNLYTVPAGEDIEDYPAFLWINELNSGDGYMGYNDWRMPTVNELTTLLNKRQYIEHADNYWALEQSNDEGFEHWAWQVSFLSTTASVNVKTTEHNVRAVREIIRTVTFSVSDGEDPVEEVLIQVYADASYGEPVTEILETDVSGEVEATLTGGTYYFTASKSGYESYTGDFTVSEDKTVSFEINEITDHVVTFSETNNTGGVSIDIFSDEEKETQVGNTLTTDGSGLAVVGLEDETYYYTASKSGYVSYSGSFVVDGENREVNFTVDKLYTVTFAEQGGVDGVSIQVYSDSERETEVGSSVETGVPRSPSYAQKSLIDGEYWFTASKSGYNDYRSNFTVDGENTEVQFTIQQTSTSSSGSRRESDPGDQTTKTTEEYREAEQVAKSTVESLTSQKDRLTTLSERVDSILSIIDGHENEEALREILEEMLEEIAELESEVQEALEEAEEELQEAERKRTLSEQRDKMDEYKERIDSVLDAIADDEDKDNVRDALKALLEEIDDIKERIDAEL